MKRYLVGSVVAALFVVTPLPAQTVDLARVTAGFSIGRIGGASLWDVPVQTVQSTVVPGESDDFMLHREARAGLTFNLHGTYYGNPHFGLTGEFTYIGLGQSNGCSVVRASDDATLESACSILNSNGAVRSTMAFQGGVTARPFIRTFLQPFLTAMVGVASTPLSTVQTYVNYLSLGDQTSLTIYQDFGWHNSRALATLAVGFATSASQGFQARAELRDSWLPLTVVTGSNPHQDAEPPHRTSIVGLPSLIFGFDIVFRKDRGKRY